MPATADSRRTPRARTTLAIVALCCTLVQVLSATFVVRDFDTPNASTNIARNIAEGRGYVVWWNNKTDDQGPREPLRAFQLPGEPVYLAAGLSWLPPTLHRYLHVPVTTVMVTALSAVAFVAGGPFLALTAGALATFDPFIVVHGPVWDDTFLAAALEWLIFAVLMWQLREVPCPLAGRQWGMLTVTFAAAALASATRLQSQFILGLVALGVVSLPALKPIRRQGWAVLAAIAIVLAIWGGRNLLVLGVFMVGSTHDGQTLLHANHPLARASLTRTGVTQTDADMSVPAGTDEVTMDAVFRRRAIDYITSHPFDAALTAGAKTTASLTGFDFRLPWWARRNVVSVASALVVGALAIYGLGVFRRISAGGSSMIFLMLACGVVALITCAMLAIGPAGLRYRISLTPVLCLAAASALQSVVRTRPGQGSR